MSRAEPLDHARCHRAVSSRDARFDGAFVTAVHTTGIYCRPSCPARTPRPENVSFYKDAAGAQRAGFRACRRCRPDAVPGSAEWDARADVVGRAMRLIRDGVVEREGVEGLSRRLGYSPRQVQRALVAEVGAGPLSIARAHRAHTARTLIETTGLPFTEVAFASGFASIRQFNDTIRQVYDATPGALRARRSPRAAPGPLRLALAVRAPFAADELMRFLAARAVPGVERVDGSVYRRGVRVGDGVARLSLEVTPGGVALTFDGDPSGLHDAVRGARRLCDLDADPVAIDGALGASHPALSRSVAQAPGLRVPGQFDGFEVAVRAVLGQQVSVAAARTTAGALAARLGQEAGDSGGGAWPALLFPTPQALAEVDPGDLGVPRSRGRALVALARAVADGRLDLSAGADRDATRAALESLPGIGPWTAGYIAMRALRDPDAMPHADLVVRRVAEAEGLDPGLDTARPWRAYATMHLWRTAATAKEER